MARTAQRVANTAKKLARRSTTVPSRNAAKVVAKPSRAPMKARRAGSDHANDITVVYEGPGRRFEIHRGTTPKGKPCWYAVETVRDGDALHEAIVLPSEGHALETCHGWIRSRGHSK